MKSLVSVVFFTITCFFLGSSTYAQDKRESVDPERALINKEEFLKNHAIQTSSVASTSLPLKMSYQGLLTTTGGTAVADGSYDLSVGLYDSLTNGSAQWTETHTGVPVVHGVFSITVGETTPLNLQFNKPFFVQLTAINGPAGPSYPLTFSPRSELTSSPYSLGPWMTNGADIYYKHGAVGIGSSAPESSGLGALKLDIADEDGYHNLALRNAGSGWPEVMLAQSRGTLSSRSVSVNGDRLGGLTYWGHDGTGYQYGAGIFGDVDSVPSVGMMPTRLSFYTQNQAKGWAKRLQLDRNGNFDIDPWEFNAGALSPGLIFGEPASGEGISSKRTPGVNRWGLDFYTSYLYGSNLPRMSITNFGDVGIGTRTPTHRLHVYSNSGETVLGIQNVAGHLWQLYSTGPGNSEGAGHFMLRDSNTSAVRMFVSGSNGNVGIGTTTPIAKLHVHDAYGGIGGVRLALTDNSSGSTILDGLAVIYGSLNGYLWNYENGSLLFGSNNIERMRVDAAGRVGIGTISPSKTLEVSGSAKVRDTLFASNVSSNSPLRLQTAGITRIHVDDVTGYVGIGTTAPTSNLELNGKLKISAQDGLQIVGSQPYLTLTDASAGGINSFIRSANGDLVFLTGIAGTMIIKSGTGYVGIGSQVPADQMLTVFGDASKTGTAVWKTFSDRRLKQDINPFGDGLSVLNGIKPVTFRYNGKLGYPTDETYVGVIAQEIETVAPYTVDSFKAKLNPEDVNQTDILRFDANALTYICINAIKELNVKVEELKKLREEHQSVSSRLASLESIVKSLMSELKKGASENIGELK